MYPCSRLLKPLYRLHYRLINNDRSKVHLGCGTSYLTGFVNIDGNFRRRVDYALDIRVGLPFPDDSIEFIYSCHMMEHLHIWEAIDLLRECRRVLSRTGYMRLTLPDFGYVRKLLSGEEVCEFPRRFRSKEGQAINHLFCDGQHKYAFSEEVIRELASEIGFSNVVTAPLCDSKLPDQAEPGGSFSVNLFK